jgi:hypothetical protein
VGEVAIERPDGPVVDALREAGVTVVVISPNQPHRPPTRADAPSGVEEDRVDTGLLTPPPR